jgi:phosphatidylserine decarboxylase
VNHYHRYCYIDDGKKGENVFIPGKLHTVRPIALRSVPVFTENCREYTLMDTENFGTVAQIEVGAMLVGKIANLHGSGHMTRGEEKGRFLYGGSTIVVLLQKDAVKLRDDLWEMTAKEEEVPVKMGECIGIAPEE